MTLNESMWLRVDLCGEVEHVWPNSKLGVEEIKRDQKKYSSDLHNLKQSQL